MSNRLFVLLSAACVLAVVVSAAAAYAVVTALTDGESRQDIVAARGAQVMPFDLDRTLHVFNKTANGGVQTVTVLDPADDDQVPLIRSHLREEAKRFARGDFGDPASIHGDDMPGLGELAAAGPALTIAYGDLPDGARMVYSSTDPDIVDALHRWFDAQVADHGDHARH
jgi:hypothetical protein